MNGFIVYDHHWNIWGFGPDVAAAWEMAEGNLNSIPRPTRTRRHLLAHSASMSLLEALEDGPLSNAQWRIRDGVARLLRENF